LTAPFIETVFHPADFGAPSESAFAHALAIALVRQSELTILHAGRETLAEDEWTKFPGVRATLERWGLLEAGSPRSAVFDEFAVHVTKVAIRGRNPTAEMLKYLDGHPMDLIVIGTEANEGRPSWLRQSVAERVARHTEALTLFVPDSSRGFVSADDGSLHLRRILIPVDHHPSSKPAVEYASRIAAAIGDTPVETVLLHVGPEEKAPVLELPDSPACRWERRNIEGDVLETITATADSGDFDLIVMSTAGAEGILDALRGSVTEQILRRVRKPLLAVPAG
jgi:nucleotide-binding universal stress UspA family protein